MPRRRVKVNGEVAFYHCIARTTGGDALLHADDKECFRRILRRVEAFSGVTVITFVAMSNHVHLLVRVPVSQRLSDAELVTRYKALHAIAPRQHGPTPEVLEMLLGRDDIEAERWRRRLQARMHDISEFMKTLKQRFSIWFNKTHGRFGTLWAERFTSILVEGSPQILSTVAAYIDLNPVRAGLTKDPAEYRWCGYAEAMAGNESARNGLAAAFANKAWERIIVDYRLILFGIGLGKHPGKSALSREAVLKTIHAGGKVTRAEALRCRLRFLSAGMVLGSKAFVNRFRASREIAKSPSKPPPLPKLPLSSVKEWGDLTILNRLRGPAVEESPT